MKNADWKDVWLRAFKIFLQAAVSCFAAGFSGVNFMIGDQASLAVSADAAGLSAVWNAF